jgi:two-component system chemotaxis response regulator CheB
MTAVPLTPLSRALLEPSFDFVALTASYGGVEALRTLVSGLPTDFPVPLGLVLHVGARPSALVSILKWNTQLSVRWAETGLRPRPRTLYVAPPDRHLELNPRRTFHLSDGPRRNFTRPAADPLFESVARTYGSRCIGVVLTGMGKDGLQGARTIRAAGGLVLSQDQATSAAFGMPGSVVAEGQADFVLPITKIAPALVSLIMVPGTTEFFGLPKRHPPPPANNVSC